MRVGLACLLLAAPLGCDVQKGPAQARLWTVDDYVALYQGQGDAKNVPPLPESLPIGKLLVDAGNGHYQLVISPTLEGEYQAAYVTTDLWQSFDEIWVQPMFILVTGWAADGTPQLFAAGTPRARPIFSVGPKSRFYSPYWETIHVKVPGDVAEDRYRSATDILSDRTLETRASVGRTASLLSPAVMIDPPPMPERLANPLLPAMENWGPTVVRRAAYLDGEAIEYLDFGEGGFQWDKRRVVEEVPLFDLTFRDPTGRLRSFGGPKIGGMPAGMSKPPILPNGRPLYGAYWRLVDVELPSSARVFAPTQFMKFREKLLAAGVPVNVETTPFDGKTVADVEPFVGHVVLDPACLESYDKLTGCSSLLEGPEVLMTLVPASAFHKTDLTVTCPFVSYRDKPVPNP